MSYPDRDVMRAVSLWQPWASLVAVGAKAIETRPRRAPRTIVGERIVIHAAQTRHMLWLSEQPRFREFVRPGELPLGALVATARVVGSFEMTDGYVDALYDSDPQEYTFGNFAAGRWAWQLADVRALVEPVPWRGKQGVFFVPSEALV